MTVVGFGSRRIFFSNVERESTFPIKACTLQQLAAHYGCSRKNGCAAVRWVNVQVTSTRRDKWKSWFSIWGRTGLGNAVSYNGNISAAKWKGAGIASGATDQRAYNYKYDYSDRLTAGTFKANTGSAWTKEAGTLDEKIAYDVNGNILKLLRNKNVAGLTGTVITSTATAMDSLTYTYGTGNQLRKVKDSGTTEGFSDGVNLSTEYTYDTLGNLKKDANKAIDSIVYNVINKPTRIKFHNGNVLTYKYDASGGKLTMKSVHGDTTDITDYVNGFVYTNTVLSFFPLPEGRVVKNTSGYEYQYSITDHLGNTRVMFSSVTPAPTVITATFEGDASDNSNLFSDVGNVTNFSLANHTPGGGKVLRLQQSYPVGASKSLAVYPGDKIDMEVYAYYTSTSGYGTTNETAGFMINAIAAAFGGVTGGAGDAGRRFAGVSTAITQVGLDANQGDTKPTAALNYILFDLNYKVIDMGWQHVTASAATQEKLSFSGIMVKKAGYLFVYLSYEDLNNYVDFDDLKITYTPTKVLQYNEYYPFGLQTGESFTRSGATPNNFLANGATEFNVASKQYDLDFRNYDPILGRLNQVDPMAAKYASATPYNYALNNPVSMTDRSGLDPLSEDFWKPFSLAGLMAALREQSADVNNADDHTLGGGGGSGHLTGANPLSYQLTDVTRPFTGVTYFPGSWRALYYEEGERITAEEWLRRHPGREEAAETGSGFWADGTYNFDGDGRFVGWVKEPDDPEAASQGGITIVQYNAYSSGNIRGVNIILGYNDQGSGYSDFKWIQTVNSNASIWNEQYPLNDPYPADDNLPFYYTEEENKRFTNINGFDTEFFDRPTRYNTSEYTYWTAELSLVGKGNDGGYRPITTISYGFEICNGVFTLLPIKINSNP